MRTPPPGLVFRQLEVPATLDGAGGDDFRAFTAVRNEIYAEITGNHDEDADAGEILSSYQPSAYHDHRAWLVELDGEVVGRLALNFPQEEGSRTSYPMVELLRASWGRGIGSAGLALLEDLSRDAGRPVVQTWAEHPQADGERLTPPTGFGSVPNDHVAAFFAHRGYSLEQIERKSVLDLAASDARIHALNERAAAAASGYRIASWVGTTPPEFVEGYAWVKSRMSTDAPAADLEIDEEVWDAARVAEEDAEREAGRQLVLVTVAIHEETGHLAGFTELQVGPDRSAATLQGDTLVLREHRGHRLGLLLKTASLLEWRRRVPDSPRQLTWNAEENRPMLSINEEIGYAPAAYIGVWKKVLDA